MCATEWHPCRWGPIGALPTRVRIRLSPHEEGLHCIRRVDDVVVTLGNPKTQATPQTCRSLITTYYHLTSRGRGCTASDSLMTLWQ